VNAWQWLHLEIVQDGQKRWNLRVLFAGFTLGAQ
jgi:hypothetical protein